MHKDFDLTLKNISKIEGHTHLEVKVKNKKVVSCKLKIDENKRFFTQAVEGLKYSNVPTTMSRICGTCSSAHVLCSIEAIEKALGIKVSEQTTRLRNLLINSGHLRDHAMHIYFFILPDIFNKDSILDFGEKEHEWLHDGLDVKDAGNYLSTIIGGRAVHPPNAIVGGFTGFPNKQEIETAREKLKSVREKILKLTELLYKNRTVFKRKTNYVALVNGDYNFLKGHLEDANGKTIKEEDYGNHLQRFVLPYSNATAFEFEKEEYLVGALARMNINKENLNPSTKKDIKKYLEIFPSDNVFDNNIAQVLEMLQIIDSSLEILKKEIKPEEIIEAKTKISTGVGVIEAPRGNLYYRLDLNDKGIVTFADLCIPTQQNIFHIENSIARYTEKIIDMPKEKITLEIEKMIRAYDPCMSCAAHFLKIDWKE
jgi:coenzyme F420-reducing hydrogenase alpha subunit